MSKFRTLLFLLFAPLAIAAQTINGVANQTVAGVSGGGANPIFTFATFSGTRTVGTNYQNTSSFARLVFLTCDGGASAITVVSDATTTPTTQVWSASNYNAASNPVSFVVMPSNYYKVTGSSCGGWNEWTLNTGTTTASGDLVASKALSTTYQNTGAGFRLVQVVLTGTTSGSTITVKSDSATTPTTTVVNQTTLVSTNSAFFLVPANYYYTVTASAGSLSHWNEYTTSLPATFSGNMFTAGTRSILNSTATPKVTYTYFNNSGKNKFVQIVETNGSTGTGNIASDDSIPSVYGMQSASEAGGSVRTMQTLWQPNYMLSAWTDNGTITQTTWVEYTLGN